jgi:segregation and condensation protein B
MPNPSENAPSLQQIVCALVLGADHPITLNEIQKILADVEADDRQEQLEKAQQVSDEDLEAVQAAADAAAPGDDAAPADTSAEAPAKPAKPALKLTSEPVQTISTGALRKILADLQKQFHELNIGVELVEASGGYRFQTASDCGKWVRKMLNKGKPARLSRPSIETLAIIAYRQPVSRSEIESIRGVYAGHVVKALMEMQLVRIIGRSDLPGRPFLFGTTPAFLDHFGLKSLKDLEPIRT